MIVRTQKAAPGKHPTPNQASSNVHCDCGLLSTAVVLHIFSYLKIPKREKGNEFCKRTQKALTLNNKNKLDFTKINLQSSKDNPLESQKANYKVRKDVRSLYLWGDAYPEYAKNAKKINKKKVNNPIHKMGKRPE